MFFIDTFYLLSASIDVAFFSESLSSLLNSNDVSLEGRALLLTVFDRFLLLAKVSSSRALENARSDF